MHALPKRYEKKKLRPARAPRVCQRPEPWSNVNSLSRFTANDAAAGAATSIFFFFSFLGTINRIPVSARMPLRTLTFLRLRNLSLANGGGIARCARRNKRGSEWWRRK